MVHSPGPVSSETAHDEVPHHAVPPPHTCRNCSRPWPCPTAQVNLLAEFYGDPVGLAVYLSVGLSSAIRDRGELGLTEDIPEMYQRYLGWIRMGPPAPAAPALNHVTTRRGRPVWSAPDGAGGSAAPPAR